jgi:type II secretory pathway pseudopilin PulG
MRMIGKEGQVWVETVIYTLIGLAIIALVLAAALPKINAKKDEVMIEQSIEALSNINSKVYEVFYKPEGNNRIVDLEIRKGALIINMDDNTVSWILDSSFLYSQENEEIAVGNVYVNTTRGKPWQVELKLNYSDMDIRYNDDSTGTKRLDVAPTLYKLAISKNTNGGVGNPIINFAESG